MPILSNQSTTDPFPIQTQVVRCESGNFANPQPQHRFNQITKDSTKSKSDHSIDKKHHHLKQCLQPNKVPLIRRRRCFKSRHTMSAP
mmetsp:Transcript_28115/g.58429  ORF Transcript_28115/g.58429 Transcript_28115/m.58429 type:complete len:87 (+) Transcript_28115:437-697(+)